MNKKIVVIIFILVLSLGLGCVGTEKVNAFSVVEKPMTLLGEVKIPFNEHYIPANIYRGNITVDGKEVECLFATSGGASTQTLAMDCKW